MASGTECKKVKFATQADAEFYIQKLKKTSTRSIVPERAYLCQKCFSWHLTSSPDRNSVLLQKNLVKINELGDRIAELNSVIESKNKLLKEKNKLISDLNVRIHELKMKNKNRIR